MSDAGTTAPGATRVWDLADASAGPARRRRRTGLGGPVAATAGAAALAAAFAPSLAVELRWSGVVLASLVALPLGARTMRRRRTATSFVLALVGVVAPFAAGVGAWDAATAAPPAVRSSTVPDATMLLAEPTLSESRGFAALPPADRAEASSFAADLALRLHALHGSSGPFPTALEQTQGMLIETSGVLRGAALGAMPGDTRLVYDVAASRSAFRISVVSVSHPDAWVSATSSLVEVR